MTDALDDVDGVTVTVPIINTDTGEADEFELVVHEAETLDDVDTDDVLDTAENALEFAAEHPDHDLTDAVVVDEDRLDEYEWFDDAPREPPEPSSQGVTISDETWAHVGRIVASKSDEVNALAEYIEQLDV